MKNYIQIIIALIVVASCSPTKYKNIELEDGVYADIQTNRGDVIVKTICR